MTTAKARASLPRLAGAPEVGSYVQIDPSLIPDKVRFDVPRRNQGQTVEVAYGGFDRSEHDEGDMYERITDRSTGGIKYSKRVE